VSYLNINKSLERNHSCAYLVEDPLYAMPPTNNSLGK